MKKIVIVLLLCMLGWLIKLSYDFYQLSQQHSKTQQQLQSLEKQNNKLNDQIAAFHRSPKVEHSQTANAEQPQVVQTDALQLIRQKLDLVDFALNQQQVVSAVEQLQDLDSKIDNYALAPALQQSLHQVIAKDIQVIQQYSQQIIQQQNQANDVLQRIDVLLAKELAQPHLKVAQQEKAAFWQNWLRIERAETAAVDLQQRSLIYKEAQLRLLVLRQLLLQNQYLAVQDELKSIEKLMSALPDQQSQQITLKLKQLQQRNRVSIPQLNTRILLG